MRLALSCLPQHGRVDCPACHAESPLRFDKTQTTEAGWRITANPLAWGNPNAEIVVLGFSKGPTQAGALTATPHNEIAYKGSRKQVGKILAHIGLIPASDPDSLKRTVDRIIADKSGRFHFGSLIRCTVERFDQKDEIWKGSGGGMLDRFIATSFGAKVANNCSTRFLSGLPPAARLIVLFGLGTKGNYVTAARRLFERIRPGSWKTVNEISYSDGTISVVHVEHFASQGALIPNWLGENQHERARLGLLAREAVANALS
jgi:hypothetical protein